MDDKRVTYLNLGGKRYPMCFSIRAAREVSERFGGIEQMGAALSGDDLPAQLDALVWMLTLLTGQGTARLNLLEGLEEKPVSEEELWVLMDVGDLGKLQDEVMDSVVAGMSQEVETAKKGDAARGR